MNYLLAHLHTPEAIVMLVLLAQFAGFGLIWWFDRFLAKHYERQRDEHCQFGDEK